MYICSAIQTVSMLDKCFFYINDIYILCVHETSDLFEAYVYVNNFIVIVIS